MDKNTNESQTPLDTESVNTGNETPPEVKPEDAGKIKLKKPVSIILIGFLIVVLSITYIFILFQTDRIVATVNWMFAIIRPLIIGGIIAYIMKSTANFFEKHLCRGLLRSGKRTPKKARKIANYLSVVITYLVWIAALAALLAVAIPQVIASVKNFISETVPKLPEYQASITEYIHRFISKYESFEPYANEATDWLFTTIENYLQSLLLSAGDMDYVAILGSVVTIIKDIIIGLVLSVFILLGRKSLAKKSNILLHAIFKDKTANAIANEFKFADDMFSGFLEGKVIDSTIIGILYYIFLAIMNVPYAPLIAVICGVTNIIPIFGPFIGAIPSALIIFTANPYKVIPFIIFVFAIQFIDGYIIDPHIVGGNIKISAFSVIFAVTTFSSIWGFMGLLVGVPTFAVICDIVKKIVNHLLKKRGKGEMMNEYMNEFSNDPKKPKVVKAAAGAVECAPDVDCSDGDDLSDENISAIVACDAVTSEEDVSETDVPDPEDVPEGASDDEASEENAKGE